MRAAIRQQLSNRNQRLRERHLTGVDHVVPPLSIRMPLLPACFLHWTTPADENGDETLRIVSWRRQLTLQGKSFQEFEAHVIPLLDGKTLVDDICDEVADLFSKEAMLASLSTLAAQGIIVEGEHLNIDNSAMDHTPQLGWLSETAPEGQAAQARLQSIHVVLFGAGAHGAVVARALVAAGIGQLTIVDPMDVQATDLYFSALFKTHDVGTNRASALAAALQDDATQTKLVHHAARPADANDIVPLVSGSALALCCLDSGEMTLALQLNMACKAAGVPWIAASMEGSALVVGPGFFSHADGPCYMCWRMREIAASANAQARLAIDTHLGEVRSDLSGRRENLAVSADIVGGMLGAEVMSCLTGANVPQLDGRFLEVSLLGLKVEKHAVLRKPGCPVCDAMKTQP